MASNVDIKLLVKHLVNGTLSQSLCRLCLGPLGECYESIFTKICKEDREYCIADVLEDMCGITFSETDAYYTCHDCFTFASNAYKFYLQTKRNEEILDFYVNEIETNVSSLTYIEDLIGNNLCISLPEFTPQTPIFDYDITGINSKKVEVKMKEENEVPIKKEEDDEDNIVIIKTEDGQQLLFKATADGTLIQIESELVNKKTRRKREPMTYKQCSRCPIKYRFIAKLKEHMKTEHNVQLLVCKICQALMEDENDFVNHLKTHTNLYQCATCGTVFKRRATVIAHLKWHEENSLKTGEYVCKVCGDVMHSEEELRDHGSLKHNNKYTCYYCGRMYKGELSFNSHIKKHETCEKIRELKRKHPERRFNSDIKKQMVSQPDKRFTCETCGRNFQGERALLWHNRLHTNERPFTCEVCGRGFVSLNRRNQHALCAHTVPTRRCPLCPALFHLRSMVNTHIKKVHLKTHKRRNRTMRHQHVFWDTQPVPIQELSVYIQNEILELQSESQVTMDLEHIPNSTI